jgi:hypothetical protein
MEPYRSLYPYSRLLLANTESLAQRIIVLPTGSGTSADDIHRIGKLLREAVCPAARDASTPAPRRVGEATRPANAAPAYDPNSRWSWAPFRNRPN